MTNSKSKPMTIGLGCTAALILIIDTARAQTPTDEPTPGATESRTTTHTVTESVEWGHEQSSQRSQVGLSSTQLPGKTKVMKSTTEIRRVIDLSERPVEQQCKSDIDIEYYQRNTEAEVRALFTTSDCESFDATYRLQIAYFDQEGKFQRIVADHDWPAGKTDAHRTRYALGPDSELRRVSSRIVSCTCKSAQ